MKPAVKPAIQSLTALTELLQSRVSAADDPLRIWRRRVAEQLQSELAPLEFATQLTHLMLLLKRFETIRPGALADGSSIRQWLRRQTAFPWDHVLATFDALNDDGRIDAPAALEVSSDGVDERHYEALLNRFDRSQQNRRGVYFTPPAIAALTVAEADRGLAEAGAPLRLLTETACPLLVEDPAVGSGVFLTAVLRHLAKSLSDRSEQQRSERLGRSLRFLRGRDVLIPACASSYLHVAHTLLDLAVDLRTAEPIDVAIGNSLHRDPQPATAKHQVILGNPPFSAISQNRNEWIERLMRHPENGYFHVGGKPIGERKLWLNDDYVKFFRIAQERIRESGRGVIAFVTNHAMLDNASFRGMRERLLRDFPRQRIIDLHGNRKRDERQTNGRPDANVFEIEQGVAVCILHTSERPDIQFCEVFGERDAKLQWAERLTTQSIHRVTSPSETTSSETTPDERERSKQRGSSDGESWRRLEPVAPHFVLRPNQSDPCFPLGDPLPEVFELHGAAPVTARDRIVVDRDREQLLGRIERMRDRRVSDDELRAEWFPKRSASLQRTGRRVREYPPGDTRGWKLAEAREQLHADPDWRTHVRRCLYRPFDKRFVYWSPTMIDWPRPALCGHLADGDNRVLIARRLTPPDARGVFLWATDGLALDGVIRSDNRGSESLFPLWRYENGQRVCNLDQAWLNRLRQRLRCDLEAEDAFAFIYAQLQSDAYQTRFRDDLRQEFPRVFPPADLTTFRALAAEGDRLLSLHLRSAEDAIVDQPPPEGGSRDSFRLAARHPRYANGQLCLNSEVELRDVAASQWEFHVGSHQVAAKWWRDQRRLPLTEQSLTQFQGILETIAKTIRLRRETPGGVDADGHWFCGSA